MHVGVGERVMTAGLSPFWDTTDAKCSGIVPVYNAG